MIPSCHINLPEKTYPHYFCVQSVCVVVHLQDCVTSLIVWLLSLNFLGKYSSGIIAFYHLWLRARWKVCMSVSFFQKLEGKNPFCSY